MLANWHESHRLQSYRPQLKKKLKWVGGRCDEACEILAQIIAITHNLDVVTEAEMEHNLFLYDGTIELVFHFNQSYVKQKGKFIFVTVQFFSKKKQGTLQSRGKLCLPHSV